MLAFVCLHFALSDTRVIKVYNHIITSIIALTSELTIQLASLILFFIFSYRSYRSNKKIKKELNIIVVFSTRIYRNLDLEIEWVLRR